MIPLKRSAMARRPILVVEDDPYTRESLWELLDGEGYRVYEARSGMEALRALDHIARPCLLLLDLNMPEMMGVEVLSLLEERYRGNSPHRVIVITADAPKGPNRVRGRKVEALVLKPFDEPLLLELIELHSAQ